MAWRVLGVLALSACSQVFGLDAPARIMADAPMAKADAPVAAETWSAAVEIVELASNAADDDPSLTSDQLEMYFGSTRAGGMGGEDIWITRRAAVDQPWQTPVPVTELNTVAVETTPRVTGDGLAMFLGSNRLGGSVDVLFSTRSSRSDAWSAPAHVAELSTAGSDTGAAANDAVTHVILCANPTMPGETLYVSDRTSSAVPWAMPSPIVELDDPSGRELDPFEPTPVAVYYARPDSDGTHDLWVARRSGNGPYGAPVRLNGVNTPANERDPWVSADERVMVFSSDRNGTPRLFFATRLD